MTTVADPIAEKTNINPFKPGKLGNLFPVAASLVTGTV